MAGIRVGLSSGSIERAEEFISRSKQAPLQVLAIAPSRVWDPTFQRILSQLHRVEYLRLESALEASVDFHNKYPSSAQLLRSLQISMDVNVDNHKSPFVPAFLRQCAPPTLVYLSMDRCQLECIWKRGVLPQSMACVILRGGSFRPRYEDFADAINGLSRLEYLESGEILPPLPDDLTALPPTCTQILLPALRQIHVAASTLSCVHFLDHCIFPVATRIFVNVSYGMTRHTPARLMATPLVPKLQRRISGIAGIKAIMSTSSLAFEKADAPKEPLFKLMIPSRSVMQGERVLGGLFAKLPLDGVAELQMKSLALQTGEHDGWRRFLSAFTGLRMISFTDLLNRS